MASTSMASAHSLALAGPASRLACLSREHAASRRSAASTWRVSAARASKATMALDKEEEEEEEEAHREPTPEELDAEARVLLQWPELSAQVRAFTATTLGYRACDPVLPLGADFEASRRLLAETSAAAALKAEGRLHREAFEGTRDIRPWVLGAKSGRVLSGGSLADIATTSAAAKTVGAEVGAASATETESTMRALESLRDLAAPLGSIPETLEPEIRRCVAVPGGTVRDDASEKLREIRAERRETETALRALLLEKASFLARKNFAERAQVVSRLGRECIPMKAGAQSEMDGVVLGASGTGATVFKEPAEATPLNNRLMELTAEEEEETERVLRALTKEVLGADHGQALLDATEALAQLDLAAARAEHADWLSAKAPRLFRVDTRDGNEANAPGDPPALHLPGMQHPLLLQPRLFPLPRGGKVGEEEEVDGWESGADAAEAQDAEEEETASEETTPRVRTRAEATDVVPVDFCPPPDTRLVAITGPNTGGKTASLKALGLALLMARAGLHLPTDARETAAVPWTSRVLADLGDAQSLDLDGGLSTFSAHLTRLRRILTAARDTRDAVVVLLDEPGGGTDPAEGAALAAAVLRASAERSVLTVATSHYEEVKALAGGATGDLASSDGGEAEARKPPLAFPGAANAAVEFDTATLRPTYRLLWGTSGESNALAVARGLGLEAHLADAAERRWRRARAADGADADTDAGEDLAELAAALAREREVQEVRAARALEALDRARDLHADITRRGAARLSLRASLATDAAAERGAAGVAEAQSVLAAATTREDLDAAADALMPDGWILDAATGDAVPGRQRRRRRDPEDARLRDGDDFDSFDSFDSVDEPAWVPRVGSTVTVRRMGDAEAEVVDVDELAGEVVVRMGSITSRAPLAGVSPVVGKY